MQAAPLLTPQDSSGLFQDDVQDASIDAIRRADDSFMGPPDSLGFSPGKEEPMDDGNSPQAAVKAGPGRKSRACNECKRQKMKCEVPVGNRKCKHCLRRKIECSLQFAKPSRPIRPDNAPPGKSSSTAETYEQKLDSMRAELHQVRSTLDALVNQGSLTNHSVSSPSLSSSQQALYPPQSVSTGRSNPHGMLVQQPDATLREDNMRMGMTRENSLEQDGAGNGEVAVEEPMQSLYEVTRLRNLRSSQSKTSRPQLDAGNEPNDLITRGLISESEAQELYITFHTSLNHYLWVGLEQVHSSLQSVRRSSELLTATILVVTALHIPTSAETFDKCYKEFLTLISSSMFSRFHSVDDVRGLCIAAFWLSDVSWKLSGHAIRVATELNIHKSFPKALTGDREHFLRARLWYMLYVCDRHFSLVYSRPQMVSESLQIREVELFRELPLADGLDQRILSQVTIMEILTRVTQRFVEPLPMKRHPAAALCEEDFAELRNYNLEIDRWRMRWQPRQEVNHFIGTYPLKGIILYSYFAKLQLNALAVRGVSISQGQLSTERKEFANMAVAAAASILTFVQEEEDLRRALVGMPLYFHTMITFAAVFLMKVTTKWQSIPGLNVDPVYNMEVLERVINLFRTSVTSDRHILPHIAAGLEKILSKSKACTPGLIKTSDGYLAMQDRVSLANGESDGYHGSQMGPPQNTMPAFPDQDYDDMNAASWISYPGDMADMIIMNDGWLQESFGDDCTNSVYNLLQSQFSY